MLMRIAITRSTKGKEERWWLLSVFICGWGCLSVTKISDKPGYTFYCNWNSHDRVNIYNPTLLGVKMAATTNRYLKHWNDYNSVRFSDTNQNNWPLISQTLCWKPLHYGTLWSLLLLSVSKMSLKDWTNSNKTFWKITFICASTNDSLWESI